MGLFAVVGLLEVWPMSVFIRWRVRMSRGQEIDLSRCALFARINRVQLVCLVLIPFVAAMMTRGIGMSGS